MSLQLTEARLPERPIPFDPPRHVLEWHGVDLVHPLAAAPPAHHESSLSQHAEVIGDGGAAGPKVRGQRSGVGGAFTKAIEDRPAGGVGEGVKEVAAGLGSVQDM